MRIFYDTDAKMDCLRGKKIAIIGYGSQGHAQAQNLRDSGLHVVVAARSGGPGYEKAVEDGFSPVSAREAAEQCDVIQMLTPTTVRRPSTETISPLRWAPAKPFFFHTALIFTTARFFHRRKSTW